jgi:LPXTG-motif cell wall-anchored protein
MVRRKIGSTLAACGIVMLLFGMSALPAQGAAPSPVRLAPSPRPALSPNKESGGAVLMGHITGTVIDLNSGAPAAGVAVNVGGAIVWSDANGNYDHWLPVGTYTVTLALADGQGAPAQDTLTVPVLADVATVQHLNFRGQQPALVAPTAAAARPAAAPTAAAGAAPAGGEAAVTPKRLPVTGESGTAAWLWLGFGMALLLAGGLVGFGPVLGGRSPAMVLRAHAANSALLRGLLAAPAPAPRRAPRAAAPEGDELLAALLAADRRGRDGQP